MFILSRESHIPEWLLKQSEHQVNKKGVMVS